MVHSIVYAADRGCGINLFFDRALRGCVSKGIHIRRIQASMAKARLPIMNPGGSIVGMTDPSRAMAYT